MLVQHPGVLSTPEAKRVIRNFNRVAMVLLEFEMLYHHSWMQKVEGCISTIQMYSPNRPTTCTYYTCRHHFDLLPFFFVTFLSSLNYPTHLDTSCPDGGCPGWPAGLSARQVSTDRGAVCKLWPRDSDPDKGGELHDKDEFGDTTICCSVAAETGHPEKELQQITGWYYLTQFYTLANTYNLSRSY